MSYPLFLFKDSREMSRASIKESYSGAPYASWETCSLLCSKGGMLRIIGSESHID